MTEICKRPGTDSQEQPVSRCLRKLCLQIVVVRVHLGGSVVGILPWVKGPSATQCAFIGPVTNADGLESSVFKTVAPSSCMS